MTNPELLEAARAVIKQRFVEGRHHIGAALRTRPGNVFTGVHLEAYIGRVAVCAEAIALGAAATAGDTEIDTIVAVNELGAIVSPCGICRELISDYSPVAKVIMPKGTGHEIISIADLLPQKYSRD